MMNSQETSSLASLLTQEEETYALYSADPDYRDDEVYLSAESFIRLEVTARYACHR